VLQLVHQERPAQANNDGVQSRATCAAVDEDNTDVTTMARRFDRDTNAAGTRFDSYISGEFWNEQSIQWAAG
jgi:hypothetical protein